MCVPSLTCFFKTVDNPAGAICDETMPRRDRSVFERLLLVGISAGSGDVSPGPAAHGRV